MEKTKRELRVELDIVTRDRDLKRRQLETIQGNFQQLWGDERTMRLRYSWLEEAATNVVTACPEHLAGQLDELREELGIETKETENGDT